MSNEAAAADREARMNRSEGERRLPEDRDPSASSLDYSSESPDQDTLRMLQEVGLDESMPIDPSSLRALQELCTPKQGSRKVIWEDTKQPAVSNLEAATEETKDESPTDSRSLVPSEVLRPLTLGRVTSDLTMAMRSEVVLDERTDASTAGSTQQMTNDKRILDQLQMQTALIMDLQRRVDDLTQIVLQQSGVAPTFHALQQPRPPEAAAPGAAMGGQHPQVHEQQPRAAPQVQHEMILLPRIANMFWGIPDYVRSTRLAEIWRVFWQLHARDMNGRIDGNLVIKIIFMGAIVMAKVTASNKRKKRSNLMSFLQFHGAVLLIVGGFLVQTGYARFFYDFWIKDRYPQRIWNGEQVTIGPRPILRQGREGQQAAAAAANQPGILRGAIPRGPQAGGVAKVVVDIFYIFVTLVLSILPMWKPEALQEEGNAEQQAANNDPQNEENGDENNDAPME